MKIVEDKDQEEFGNLIDQVSIIVFKESFKNVAELEKSKVNPLDNVNEIGSAVGQVVLDKVIELTEDMDRKKLLIFLTELAINHSTEVMLKNKNYQAAIMYKALLG